MRGQPVTPSFVDSRMALATVGGITMPVRVHGEVSCTIFFQPWIYSLRFFLRSLNLAFFYSLFPARTHAPSLSFVILTIRMQEGVWDWVGQFRIIVDRSNSTIVIIVNNHFNRY